MAENETPEPQLISWDWAEQPSLDELSRAIEEVTEGRVRLYRVDTGSDQYAIVLAAEAMTGPQVDAMWTAQTT